MRALSFRTTVTLAVLTIVTALAVCLIVLQTAVLHAATKAAASTQMDVTAASTLTVLQGEVSELQIILRILSTSPFLADSNERKENGGAIGLFKTALRRLPQADSIYVGYDNGCWLQVRRTSDLSDAERNRLGAPAEAVFAISLVLPNDAGELPLWRVFHDEQGNDIARADDAHYGYDVRKRDWYQKTLETGQELVSEPYRSSSLRSPVITLSTPLRGKARGVIGLDLKLDTFSDFVYAHRPGKHGTAMMFNAAGTLIAHQQYRQLVADEAEHPNHRLLPNIHDQAVSPVAEIIHGWDGANPLQGTIDDSEGHTEFFHLMRFALGETEPAFLLLIAREDDFGDEVRKQQWRGFSLALVVGACFIPAVWFFAGGISRSLRRLAVQARQIGTLAQPDAAPLRSRIIEIHELGAVLHAAQRTIWSFGHFMSKDIVGRILDGSLSTSLGGTRQEVTILFTDVENFTGLTENADPDSVMRQTSRHFTALSEVFLAEGGTIDKYIGDSVMVFWNAPRRSPDHAVRACRAALAAKAATDVLNVQFQAEGLQPFKIRIGIHVGDVVVGNIGSMERMDYTVLGATVNLASRLEGLNKEYGTWILVSDAVRQRAGPAFHFRQLGPVIAKGMTAETQVYELAGMARAGGATIDGPPAETVEAANRSA